MERKEEIEIIATWLSNPQVSIAGITQANTVGIQGLGGVGKSTLAAYFYHSLDFTAKFWADVSLKPDFTVFAEKIIVALGGKVSFPIDITELTNNLLQLLSQRRCLLVVDNLETLLDTERNWQDEYYQQFFNRWLQQGICSTLLITTQDKPQLFQGLQHWYPLGGMKIAEGVNLFKQFEIIGTNEELEEFIKYVNGHPLTIKLAAGFLINDCDRQFSQIEELELEQFELAYQEVSGSHRNKQDARLAWIIQQHLDRLTIEQTDFLVNLSVYRLPFNREAATYMWHESEVKPIVIQRKLQQLCDRSLLTKTETNSYQFESLVKKFILQQDIDLTNAHLQAIQYYFANLKEEESWQVFEDVSEYLELIDHCCELKQYDAASKVINFCLSFLYLQGYYAILIKIHEKLIFGWQENLQPEEHVDYAWALNRLGVFERNIGNVQDAISYYERALEMFRTIRDKNGEANSLGSLGNAYDSLGEYQRAIDFHQQSLAIQQQIGNKNGEANSFNNLGIAYDSLGEYQRAIDYLQQSLAIQQQIGDKNGEANSLGSLGNAYDSLGEYQRAIDFHQQSLAIQQQIGNKNGEANSFNNLGIAYDSLGEYQRAIDYLQQSLAIQQQIGDKNGEANSFNNLGNAYYSLGEYQRAIDFLQQSLAIQQQIGDKSGEASSFNNLGSAYDSLGEYQRAIDYHQQSLDIQQQIGNKNGEANSFNNLGIAYDSLGEYQRAIDFHQQSLAIKQQVGDKRGEANSFNNLGNAYYSLGEYQQAIDFLQQSLAIQQQIGDKNGAANSFNNLGNAYYSLGEYQQAIDYHQQSLAIQQQIGNLHGEADSWFNLGITHSNLQQNSVAKTDFEKARKLYQAMGLDKKVENCDTAIQSINDNL